MGAAASVTKSPATLVPGTLIIPGNHHQIRHFARWTPYKPLPKAKHYQKLRAIRTLKNHIKDCYLVSPFTCHGFSANQFKALKHPLVSAAAAASTPGAAKLVVAKNSLVAKAFAGTQWEALIPCMKGMNALLFVKKEEMAAAAMGGVKTVVKEGKLEFNQFTGAVVAGQLYGHLDLELLETMTSKVESDGMLLGSLYSPASSLIALLQGFGDECDMAKGADDTASQ